MRMKSAILLSAFLLAAASRAEAPPAEAASAMGGRLFTWLTTESTEPVDFLVDSAIAVPLKKTEAKTPAAQLAGRFAGGRVLATVIYTGRPTTLASDLSQQLQGLEGVPPEKLQALLVHPTRVTRANQVASDFVVETLGVADDDAVGVAVIWYPDAKHHSLLNGATPEMKLAMVLFAVPASKTADEPKIARIAFGNLDAPERQ
jgi:hypothetical protein